MADTQRTITFTDASPDDETLEEIAGVEAALGLEVARPRSQIPARLSTNAALRSERSLSGRPLWWWRAMLVAWTHAPATRRAHSHDLLRGLGCALRDFEDRHLLSYLETIEDALRHSA